jgi:hypothetical protein
MAFWLDRPQGYAVFRLLRSVSAVTGSSRMSWGSPTGRVNLGFTRSHLHGSSSQRRPSGRHETKRPHLQIASLTDPLCDADRSHTVLTVRQQPQRDDGVLMNR